MKPQNPHPPKPQKKQAEGVYVYGAREHNLKNLNVFVPHHKITVVTGLSGSGKSSLVFDTIYAEGRRRYVESLSSHTRFFISQLKRPDVDSMTGLCPAAALDQSAQSANPRSTVGTLTESYDYVRLFFTRLGSAPCPHCKKALLSQNNAGGLNCTACKKTFPPLEPKLFSFNSPKGACPLCKGLGLREQNTAFDESSPSEDLEHLDDFSDSSLSAMSAFSKPCTACGGRRLNPFALQVKVQNKNISDWVGLSLEDLSRMCARLRFKKPYNLIAEKILEKLQYHLRILINIGLGYLSLDRSIVSLSGGEAQRVRLARQISSPLIGALYILDEPSRGLHAKDQGQLLSILSRLKKQGSTVLMVEHDAAAIQAADHIIDLGPGGGEKGGFCMAQGSVKDITRCRASLTGAYLSGKKQIPLPKTPSPGTGKKLTIKKASGRNLKSVNVQIPLGCLVGVTGVSGSGKSTLIIDTLYKAVLQKIYKNPHIQPSPFEKIEGLEFIDKALAIHQKPIGRTSRSVPATYIGVMLHIRSLFSWTREARTAGFSAQDFSFNMRGAGAGGRCEKCAGAGLIKHAMLFLPSAVLVCDECQGQRYSNEILSIRYKGKNIHDVLSMNVRTARKFFAHHYMIQSQLALMEEAGLGYLTLGQSSVSLSGGEAQRLKITRELSKKNTGKTLYILDEPTTGLHFDDIERLLRILKKLKEKNSTVIVIEHHIDVIKSCDWLIDLGPGGGSKGGKIMAQGRPRQLALSKTSATAPFLKQALQGAKPRRGRIPPRKYKN